MNTLYSSTGRPRENAGTATNQRLNLTEQFELIARDPEARAAFALANIVGASTQVVGTRGFRNFLLDVLDQSVNNPRMGIYLAHIPEINRIFERDPTSDAELRKLAHAFSALRVEQLPKIEQSYAGDRHSPTGYIFSGQGAVDVGFFTLLTTAVELAGSQADFENLRSISSDARGKYMRFQSRLFERASELGIKLSEFSS